MNSWFSIIAKSPALAEISIYDEIGMFGITARQFLEELKAVGGRRIILRLNSPGGDVFEGLAIYNRLKEHPGGVEVRIDGIAASMASVIAMAGAPIKIAENAFIMLHNPHGFVAGEAEHMRTLAEVLDKARGSLLKAYQAKTKLSEERLIAMLDAETWLTAAEAKAFGFVDEITVALKMAAKVRLDRFCNVPEQLTQSAKLAPINERVLKALRDEVATTQAEQRALCAEVEAINRETSHIQGENEQMRANCTRVQKEIEDLRKELEPLQAQLRQVTAGQDQAAKAIAIEQRNARLLERMSRARGFGVTPIEAELN